MNCEKCQEWISDLLDGSISREDEISLSQHLTECLNCLMVRNDLESIVSYCHSTRGEHAAPPNERALWLRIRNMVEVEDASPTVTAKPTSKRSWGWLGRSWELSLPQLAASVAVIVLIVSLTTAVGLRRWQSPNPTGAGIATAAMGVVGNSAVLDRMRQQQLMIDYWNQRVEANKARWSPQMRETFDRNLKVIDQAVNDSLKDLNKSPQDEISEEMLNAALNEKLAILKEFAEL